ncbi:MAG: hypothetical protein U5L72_12770 [Bacteroidales bacterium]|nr:hypothetical protein [Bacteroidales bacterium]
MKPPVRICRWERRLDLILGEGEMEESIFSDKLPDAEAEGHTLPPVNALL